MPPFTPPYSLGLLTKVGISYNEFWKKIVIPLSILGLGSARDLLDLPFAELKRLSSMANDEDLIKFRLYLNSLPIL